MKWLEVIKLRSTGNDFELLNELLLSFEKFNQPELVEMKTYDHAALETDLSIHLHWALGLRLVQALKEFGWVDHSVWIEKEI
jgi:hypothetical protein